MISIKRFSNILENGISTIFNNCHIHSLNNNSNGIDINLIDYNIQIEIKSSLRYSKCTFETRKSGIRFSHYSFKPNELLGKQDFYIFIEKINKISDLNYIINFNIFVVDINVLRDFMNLKHKDFTKRIQISVNNIRKLHKYDLDKFIALIKNE